MENANYRIPIINCQTVFQRVLKVYELLSDYCEETEQSYITDPDVLREMLLCGVGFVEPSEMLKVYGTESLEDAINKVNSASEDSLFKMALSLTSDPSDPADKVYAYNWDLLMDTIHSFRTALCFNENVEQFIAEGAPAEDSQQCYRSMRQTIDSLLEVLNYRKGLLTPRQHEFYDFLRSTAMAQPVVSITRDEIDTYKEIYDHLLSYLV